MVEEEEPFDVCECVREAASVLLEELKSTSEGARAKAALAGALAELVRTIC